MVYGELFLVFVFYKNKKKFFRCRWVYFFYFLFCTHIYIASLKFVIYLLSKHESKEFIKKKENKKKEIKNL